MSEATNGKPRVLVVDDSRLIQKAIRKMLDHEFDVATVDDGVDAWTALEIDPAIQVVFSDLDMPRMDGFELLRAIRSAADSRVQSLPVIIVTGAKDDETARQQALDLGATDFITKPFATTDLVARARAHASHQRLTRQLLAQTTLDALTGLLNKAGFVQRLQQDISYARRHHQDLALVRLEIDDLRGLFLRHGKDTAERLLTHVAGLLRASIRTEDSAGRIGLGSFALSLPAVPAGHAASMLARLRSEVLAGSPVPLSVVGTVASDPGPDAQEALDHAQAQLDFAREATTASTRIPDLASAPASAPSPALAAAPPVAVPPLAPAAAPTAELPPVPPAAMLAPTLTPAPTPVSVPVSAPVPAPEPALVTPGAAAAVRPIPPLAPTAAPAAVAAPVAAPPAPAAAALRLDAILDAIARGEEASARQAMPQLLQRLLPLLRLATPAQRAGLARFLLQVGKA